MPELTMTPNQFDLAAVERLMQPVALATPTDPVKFHGDPTLGGDGLRRAVDADCPHCGWPERFYDTTTRRFGCIQCAYTSDEERMTTPTLPPLVAVTDETTDRAGWMQARSTRVTASIIHSIAVGGRATWQRILANMLNGESFKGNATTARGREREAFLLDYAQTFIDPTIAPNSRLFVSAENDRIGATPDGLGAGVIGRFGVEAKSHEFGWDDADGIPQEHYDQMQLGIYVTGAVGWLYVWETMGEDGEPTLDDPRYLRVPRDDRRIAFLVREANRFLAWWDAGAPAWDYDIPAEVDDALALWADARSRKNIAAADEKAADEVIRAYITAQPDAETDGVKLAGRAASFVYSVKDDDVLDPDKWATAEPTTHAAWLLAQERVRTTAALALALYKKNDHKTTLRITPTKETA